MWIRGWTGPAGSPAALPGLLMLIVLGGCGGNPGSDQTASSGNATASGNAPRRVVLVVADGMGVATVTAARIHRGARRGLERPVAAELTLDRAPRASFVRTWSEDNMVTDSGAAITAMVTGHKAGNGVLCVRGTADGGFEPLTTLLEIAEAEGLATGVVSTSRVTHATPAGLYAHVPNRGQENDIAAALVPGRGNPALGDGVEVILGGGRRHFLPRGDGGTGAAGRRDDGRDLLAEMAGAGYRVVENAGALRRARAETPDRLLGLFADSHLAYEIDRTRAGGEEPSLPDMTLAALEILERNPRGYFLLVEAARIDHALHNLNGYRALDETLVLDDTVARLLERVGDEALVVVVADHDHVMVIAGYAGSDRDVLDEAGRDVHGVPYTALLFANGSSSASPPPGMSPQEWRADPEFRQRAGIPTRGETHGGMDVPLYAWGPERYRDRFGASTDNTEIFPVLSDAIRGR